MEINHHPLPVSRVPIKVPQSFEIASSWKLPHQEGYIYIFYQKFTCHAREAAGKRAGMRRRD
jgi:hypothetical protein